MGVVAPSGVVDGERLRSGVGILRDWGLDVRVGAHVEARQGFLAGSDAERLEDLHAMFADPLIRAVLCARGGYGIQRLAPALQLAGLRVAAKLVIGFSDATALLARLVNERLPAIHGPMVAKDLSGLGVAAREHFFRLLSDPGYRWELPVPVSIRSGTAEGPLVGGCLSVLASLLGTPWAPRTAGAILFLEDVSEPPYRLDRLLTQLRQAGLLDHLAGVVFGTMAGCPTVAEVTAGDVVRAFFADAPFPVGFGLAAGHGPAARDVENYALPLAVQVRLDTAAGRLVGLEAPIS